MRAVTLDPGNPPESRLVAAGDQYVRLTEGELHYLSRHSFRERSFEFKPPYPEELAATDSTVPELIALSLSVGWVATLSSTAVVSKWARVDDLNAALAESGIKVRGKRADLLAACLAQCPHWVERFAATRPGYEMTDKGRIELQATRPVVVQQTKESSTAMLRGFFDGHVKDARQSPQVILGFKIWARTDTMWAHRQCPLAARFEGVFLPDEMPELYPEDCPDEGTCCCVLYETVLSCEDSAEAGLLREKIAARGLPEPPPSWDHWKELAAVEAMERAKAERLATAAAVSAAGKPSVLKTVWRWIAGS